MSKLFLTPPTYLCKDTKARTQRKANDVPTDWSKIVINFLAAAGLALALAYVLAALWILIVVWYEELQWRRRQTE